MVRARVTSKGQITIPIEIRRKYQLEAGSEVAFVAEDRGPRLVAVRRRSLLDLYGSLPVKKADAGMKRIRSIAGRKLGEDLARKARRT